MNLLLNSERSMSIKICIQTKIQRRHNLRLSFSILFRTVSCSHHKKLSLITSKIIKIKIFKSFHSKALCPTNLICKFQFQHKSLRFSFDRLFSSNFFFSRRRSTFYISLYWALCVNQILWIGKANNYCRVFGIAFDRVNRKKSQDLLQ